MHTITTDRKRSHEFEREQGRAYEVDWRVEWEGGMM